MQIRNEAGDVVAAGEVKTTSITVHGRGSVTPSTKHSKSAFLNRYKNAETYRDQIWRMRLVRYTEQLHHLRRYLKASRAASIIAKEIESGTWPEKGKETLVDMPNKDLIATINEAYQVFRDQVPLRQPFHNIISFADMLIRAVRARRILDDVQAETGVQIPLMWLMIRYDNSATDEELPDPWAISSDFKKFQKKYKSLAETLKQRDVLGENPPFTTSAVDESSLTVYHNRIWHSLEWIQPSTCGDPESCGVQGRKSLPKGKSSTKTPKSTIQSVSLSQFPLAHLVEKASEDQKVKWEKGGLHRITMDEIASRLLPEQEQKNIDIAACSRFMDHLTKERKDKFSEFGLDTLTADETRDRLLSLLISSQEAWKEAISRNV